VHPAKYDDIHPDVLGAQRATGMRARQLPKLLSHVVSAPRE